jgi:hypothetical protein
MPFDVKNLSLKLIDRSGRLCSDLISDDFVIVLDPFHEAT